MTQKRQSNSFTGACCYLGSSLIKDVSGFEASFLSGSARICVRL